MKSNKQTSLDNYLISFIIHMLILLSLTLINVKSPKKVNELLIDWLSEPTKEVVQEDFIKSGSEQLTSPAPSAASQQSDVVQNPPANNISNSISTVKSIEPPIARPNSKVNSAPKTGVNSSYLAGLKSNLAGSQTGGGGFQIENDDGNIIILRKVLPHPTINDYGKVTIQFKIKADGTVDATSVIPVLIDDPNYTEESIAALKQWLFSYKSYNSSKAYRISFIFKPE
jgi:hypothetical protein